jgi:hypothetical protein
MIKLNCTKLQLCHVLPLLALKRKAIAPELPLSATAEIQEQRTGLPCPL